MYISSGIYEKLENALKEWKKTKSVSKAWEILEYLDLIFKTDEGEEE